MPGLFSFHPRQSTYPFGHHSGSLTGEQLKQVIGYVDQLKSVDVEGIEPTAHAIPVHNVLREDETRESLDQAAALKNAPQARSGHFVVPKIIE